MALRGSETTQRKPISTSDPRPRVGGQDARGPSSGYPLTAGQADGTGQVGQALLEYALVLGLVGVIVVVIFWMIGPQLATVFSSVYADVVFIPTPPPG